MSTGTKTLHQAKARKNDEFYTTTAAIAKEVPHYAHHLRGAVVYCNCDDPRRSKFVRYFLDHYDALSLGGLMVSGFDADFRGVGLECDAAPSGAIDEWIDANTIDLFDGACDWHENRATLAQCDVVITNPPYSTFGDYMDMVIGSGKRFLIVGNMTAVAKGYLFPHVAAGRAWMSRGGKISGFGFTGDYKGTTIMRDGVRLADAPGYWYTNMPTEKQEAMLTLEAEYSPDMHKRFDNYPDAINVGKTKEIPADYDGLMGVPVSFLEKHNPRQFEVVGKVSDAVLDGVAKFDRILIRRRR